MSARFESGTCFYTRWGRSMPLIITREAAVAAILGAINHLDSEPRPWEEQHIVCAIEAARRGDYDASLSHLQALRRGPVLGEGMKRPNRLLLCREQLRALLVEVQREDVSGKVRALGARHLRDGSGYAGTIETTSPFDRLPQKTNVLSRPSERTIHEHPTDTTSPQGGGTRHERADPSRT